MPDDRRVQFRYPLSHERFVEALQYLPFADPAWLYESVVADPLPYQGDVVPGVTLAFRDQAAQTVEFEGPAALLSHGCDTVPAQSEMATFAPIVSLQEYARRLPEGSDKHSKLGAIRGNRYSNLLFLPAVSGLGERVVDFSYAASVSTDEAQAFFAAAPSNERFRLTNRGWYLFIHKLTYHYCRLESPDDYSRG